MTFNILKTDARAIPIPDGVAQVAVTSPPYYGLRDYGATGVAAIHRRRSFIGVDINDKYIVQALERIGQAEWDTAQREMF